MKLTGIHHLTAVTANPRGNVDFYTQTLGMRLVKKTVNQDDTSSYHLFYADGLASPGTDITFFHWPMPRERRGTSSIVRTGFRVAGIESLKYWADRLSEFKLPHGEIVQRNGRPTLDFEDPEGQRLSLVADDGRVPANPWAKSPVPAGHQIRGLGPITISVPDITGTDQILTRVMGMEAIGRFENTASDQSESKPGGSKSVVHVYEMGDGGPAAELHVAVEPSLRAQFLGAGGVHHVAFRIPTFAEYDLWYEQLRRCHVATSGPVDRFYFRSLYFREPNGILFELATDGPGFDSDEPMEHLGEKLSLPPFLEARRAGIEAGLQPI